eukprot:CAMPEP_0171464248 /NCGR_PEP_ID=MMETSP0945-20130129/7624_1 /TAXON_ID=109269 /ORGANISM="Vaucheria litorea, Strain CCMP2940" /LENGTH=1181 /DNA_ID=CAMNT_0011991261 /DNA_START=29 /DNA_END=3574 /DNA_ORIENTATION=-
MKHMMIRLIFIANFVLLGAGAWKIPSPNLTSSIHSKQANRRLDLSPSDRLKICPLLSSNDDEIVANESEEKKAKLERPKISLNSKSETKLAPKNKILPEVESLSKDADLPKDENLTKDKNLPKNEIPKTDEKSTDETKTSAKTIKLEETTPKINKNVESKEKETNSENNVKDIISRFSKGEIDKESLENAIRAKELEKIKNIELEMVAMEKVMANEAIWASAGACAFGLVAGGLADGYFFEGKFPLCSPLAAAALTGPAYFLGKQNNKGGEIIRQVIGKPTKGVSDSITQPVVKQAKQSKENVVNFPSYFKGKVDKQINDTVQGIKAVPGNTAKALNDSANGVKQSISNTAEGAKQAVSNQIDSAKKAVSDKNEETNQAIINKVTGVKNEIQMIPSKFVAELKSVPVKASKAVADSIDRTKLSVDRKIDQTKKSFNDSISNAVAFPGQVWDNTTKSISSILPKPPSSSGSPKAAENKETPKSDIKVESLKDEAKISKESEVEVVAKKDANAKEKKGATEEVSKGEEKTEIIGVKQKEKTKAKEPMKKQNESKSLFSPFLAKKELKTDEKRFEKTEVKTAAETKAKSVKSENKSKDAEKSQVKTPDMTKSVFSPFQTKKDSEAENEEEKIEEKAETKTKPKKMESTPKVEEKVQIKPPAIVNSLFYPFQTKKEPKAAVKINETAERADAKAEEKEQKVEDKGQVKPPDIAKSFFTPFQAKKDAKAENVVKNVDKTKAEEKAQIKSPTTPKSLFVPFQSKKEPTKNVPKAKAESGKDESSKTAQPKAEKSRESESLLGLFDFFGSKKSIDPSEEKPPTKEDLSSKAGKTAASKSEGSSFNLSSTKIPKMAKKEIVPNVRTEKEPTKAASANPFDFFSPVKKSGKPSSDSSPVKNSSTVQKSNNARFKVPPKEKPVVPPKAPQAAKKVNRNFSAPAKAPTSTGPVSLSAKGKKEGSDESRNKETLSKSEAKGNAFPTMGKVGTSRSARDGEEEAETALNTSPLKKPFSLFGESKPASDASQQSPVEAADEPSERVPRAKTSFNLFGMKKSTAKADTGVSKVEKEEKEESNAPSFNPFSSMKASLKTPASEETTSPETSISIGSMFKPSLVKALKQNLSDSQIANLESLASQYASGKVKTPRAFVDGAMRVAGKGVVLDILPDIIGSLPTGEKKRELNQYYLTSI